MGPFFSSQCSSGTLSYIQSRCQEALSNLHTDPETGSHSLLALLPTTLQHCEEIHNEVGTWWCIFTCICMCMCENICVSRKLLLQLLLTMILAHVKHQMTLLHWTTKNVPVKFRQKQALKALICSMFLVLPDIIWIVLMLQSLLIWYSKVKTRAICKYYRISLKQD